MGGINKPKTTLFTQGRFNNCYLLFNDFWTADHTNLNRVKAPDYLLGASGAVLSVADTLSGSYDWGAVTQLGGQMVGGARVGGGTTILST